LAKITKEWKPKAIQPTKAGQTAAKNVKQPTNSTVMRKTRSSAVVS
jgi:hypothetical protein